ncbi:DUF6728 family protein [Flexithrix dorotheae]|uniref:DUF6728 family protein n=1 Tax=Flexithrix dorotheae TaxID=70993 RepID=UPI001FDF8485|nr:DUF6728 family protein [Flexithrix dorotheae]
MEAMKEDIKKREKNTLKDYLSLGPVLTYFFRKKSPIENPNFNLRMMHGINKISIVIFLLAILFLAYKFAFVY